MSRVRANVKTLLKVVIVLLHAQTSFGQEDLNRSVLQAVLKSEQQKGVTDLTLQCERPSTFLDMESYQYEAEVRLPQETIYSLAIVALKSTTGSWELQSQTPGSEFPFVPCISDKKIHKRFRKTGFRQNILSVSTPVFDATHHYCVLQVAYRKFTKSGYGMTCILEQTSTGWQVIAEFDFWMS